MFKSVLSTYITSNMGSRGWKLKDMSRESGLSDSTLNSYILQKVSSPSEENLLRIAAAFGDPPEVIYKMRRESMDVTSAEEKLLAAADDQARMEKFTEIVKSSMLAIMQEYLTATSAQQTEIMAHADKRVEEERTRASDLNAKVLAQCQEEVERSRIHNSEIMALKDALLAASEKENKDVRKYLRTVIRNLAIALVAVSALAVVGIVSLGIYVINAVGI